VRRFRTHSELSLEARLTNILAHELIHTQQRGFTGDTVLAASLTEGVAEFLAELTGRVTSAPLHADRG
jgi:hypothetical protein